MRALPASFPRTAFLGLATALLAACLYRKCPPNAALVVYGMFVGGTRPGGGDKLGKARVLLGGGTWVLPILQGYSFLSLKPFTLEIPLKNALSLEKIRVNIPAAFTVAVGTEPEVVQNAAVRLLGMDITAVKSQAEEIITGQMRQVVASLEIEQINRDRDSFMKEVYLSVDGELHKLGLVLLNVNILNIDDESGVIVALGQKAAAVAKQQALVDVANQERAGAIGVSEQEKEREVGVAVAEKLREIGLATQRREQEVAVAEAERDRQIGTRGAEQERAVRVEQLSADEAVGRNLARTRVAESDAQLRQAQAQFQKQAEVAEALAKAEVAESEALALAKTAAAEAQRVEAAKLAELEAPAKAEKAKVIVEAAARAEQARVIAEGEAQAAFIRAESEARGQYEMLEKKGAGLHQIVDSCGGPDGAFKLLLLEHLDTIAETSATAMSNIKFDKVVVWDGSGSTEGSAGSAVPRFVKGLAGSLPPTLEVLKEIAGVDVLKRLQLDEGGPAPKSGKATPEQAAEGAGSEAQRAGSSSEP